MRNRTRVLLDAVVLLLLAARAADEQATPVYFPAQSGNQWHYVVEVDSQPRGSVTSKIAKIETIDGEALIRLESIAGDKVVSSEHLRVVEGGLFRHRFNGIEALPPVCVIKFPVKKGDQWEIKSMLGDEKVAGTCVLDEEEVEVPAGKFKTVRVTMDAMAGAQKVETTYWYADKVGMVQQTLKLNGLNMKLKLDKYELAKADAK